MSENVQIDAVILWVDGNDPHHRNKIASYLENPTTFQNKGTATRYRQVNEIEYVVQSILKFAPFVSTIYIVTDNQTPPFLVSNTSGSYGKVKIVDHTIIFRDYEYVLPVFNSNAIETMIHRIPGLAKRYIYFNDDMFLVKPTKISDFFTEDGLPLIRGRKMIFESEKVAKKVAIKLGLKKEKSKGYLGYNRIQDYFAKLMGKKRKIGVDHTPFPMKKSLIVKFFKKNEEILKNNISSKFRNEKNVLIQSISAFTSRKKNKKVLIANYQLKKLSGVNKPLFYIKMQLNYVQKNKNVLFLNIQSLDLYSKSNRTFVISWLEKLYR